MKKIFLTSLLLLFPYFSFADLDFYLSTQNLPYSVDVWTSPTYPDADSSRIQVDSFFYREDMPSWYKKTPQEIQTLFDDLFSHLTPAERQARYNSFLSFTRQNLDQYLAFAISPNTDADIADKLTAGFVLSPFESVFQNCGIALAQRRTIAQNMITNIYNGTHTSVETMQYSDIRFGDCIVPFPDVRRGTNVITNSFPSNKTAAQALWWNHLNFWALEGSATLFSLADVTLEASYEWVQTSNLLDLVSTRIQQDQSLPKEVGKQKILFVHQNHLINPFFETLIRGNATIWYEVGGDTYDTTHPLYIQSSDTEEKRTFSGWKEEQPGIYVKTLLQEDIFQNVSWVLVPKQSVNATTYYAVLYNYDTTPPVCLSSLFSHENLGNENFIFPEYPWFRTTKYGYFVCWDEESWCFCDSSVSGCFLRDIHTLSMPQSLPHAGLFQYTFLNNAGLSQLCSSSAEQKVFYDLTSPDVRLTLPGIPEASLIREYVSNDGVLYDGVQIPEKKFYHISNDVSFQANDMLDIRLRFFDPYQSTKPQEWVSGLSSYSLSISKFENENWVEQIQHDQSFGAYNSGATKTVNHEHVLDLGTLAGIEDIYTQIGSYQVYTIIDDAAGNQSRIIFYFDIIAGDIDASRSTLETTLQNTLYADNTSSYLYTLSLRDQYMNPIRGQQIGNITHSCLTVPHCSELRLNMTGPSPTGAQALEVYNFDTLSDVEGKIDFYVRSVSPGVFTESFIVNFLNPAQSIRFHGSENAFLKPLQGILEVKVWSSWLSDTLPVDVESEFRVRVEDTQAFWYTWTLSNFSSYLSARHPDTAFILSGSLQTQLDGVYFSGIFENNLPPNETHKTLLEIVHNDVSAVIVSYILAGKTVSYYLSPTNIANEALTLSDTWELQNPVKIVGNFQGVGNTHNLTERQNITDLDTSLSRNLFRKKVEEHIKTRKNDTVLWSVKYIDKTLDSQKTYVLENNPSFETLIVRNGNIHIQNDFNDAGKVLGLISYIDTWYNAQTGYQNIGNIYVESEVKKIQSFVYADGGLISTQSGVPVSWDVNLRKNILTEQLHIIGLLFTRNTLAGGRIFAGEYMLPGGQKSWDQDLATLYDLYYTRSGNEGCERDSYGFCNTPAYIIIEYDARINSTPPKLFSQ